MQPTHHPTALVVEDDPALAGALVAHLARLGFAAHAAHTLGEARQALARETPAVLVADVGLPDGDGADLLDLDALRDACIVVITGVATRPLTARCSRRGAQLLVKSGALIRQLDPLLEPHTRRAAA